jgi:hypothetical protein
MSALDQLLDKSVEEIEQGGRRPAGQYELELTKLEMGEYEKTKKPNLTFTFEGTRERAGLDPNWFVFRQAIGQLAALTPEGVPYFAATPVFNPRIGIGQSKGGGDTEVLANHDAMVSGLRAYLEEYRERFIGTRHHILVSTQQIETGMNPTTFEPNYKEITKTQTDAQVGDYLATIGLVSAGQAQSGMPAVNLTLGLIKPHWGVHEETLYLSEGAWNRVNIFVNRMMGMDAYADLKEVIRQVGGDDWTTEHAAAARAWFLRQSNIIGHRLRVTFVPRTDRTTKKPIPGKVQVEFQGFGHAAGYMTPEEKASLGIGEPTVMPIG